MVSAGGAAAVWRSERGRWWLYLALILPLLSRLRPEELAEPDEFKAGRLYQAILQNPGINLAALRTLTGMKNGTLIYHLDRLAEDGRIRTRKRGHLRIFHPSQADPSEQANSTRYLRETQKRVLAVITAQRDATQRSIAEALNLKQPLVSYHLRQLRGLGHLQRRGLPGFYTYRVSSDLSSVPEREEWTE